MFGICCFDSAVVCCRRPWRALWLHSARLVIATARFVRLLVAWTSEEKMNATQPNQAVAPNAARALWLPMGHRGRGVTEQRRSSGMKCSLLVILLCVIAGCATHPPLADPKAGNSVPYVHPRALEQTDKPASSAEEDQARMYHQNTAFAESHPVFERSRRLIWGGYKATFAAKSKKPHLTVTYYFDAHGQLLRTERAIACW